MVGESEQSSASVRESAGGFSSIPHLRGLFLGRKVRTGLSHVFQMNIGIILLFITALILYLSFISRSFDEGDAFNFALALSRFDVAAHQPHPPGYPVFVFIASIPYLFTRNPLFSLVLVSALSGALTLIPTYAIARRLFNREIAFFSALALMVAPGFWLLSEQALSSDLFVLLLTLALSQLLAGRESRSYRYASWGTLGIALGVRPFNFVLVAPFLLETVKAGRRDLVWCLLLFLGTFSLGLVPAVLLTGYPQYLAAVLDQLTHHVRYDVNPFGLSAVDRLVVLLLELMNGVGANLPFRICRFDPFVSTSRYASINFVLLLLLCGAGVILLLVRRVRDFSNVPFLLSWILPYSAFVYLLGAPGYTRYMLPVIPAVLMMLVASGFHAVRFLRSSRLNWSIVRPLRSLARYGVILLFIVSTFAYSLPLAAVIHTEPPPNVQLAVYVSRNYDPSTTTIIVLHEFRAFQFYGRGFRYVHCCYDAQKALGIIQSYSKSSDSILITSSALDSLQKMGVMLHVIRVAEFSRSPLVKVEDSMVTLYRIQ